MFLNHSALMGRNVFADDQCPSWDQQLLVDALSRLSPSDLEFLFSEMESARMGGMKASIVEDVMAALAPLSIDWDVLLDQAA